MSNQPWICPSCNRGVAPGVETCDHGGQLAYDPIWPIPIGPQPVEPIGPNTGSPTYPDTTTITWAPNTWSGPITSGQITADSDQMDNWHYTH